MTKPLSFNLQSSIYHLLLFLLSFFVPVLIMVLALIALHVTPFGEHCLAITDAKYYLNGEMWFSRLMRGEENIFYSFNNGLGGNEWSQAAWGGFSFGNLLSFFAILETIPSVFTWICVLNVAICGLTMYVLLAYVNGHKVSNLIFSTTYSLIGFNVVNWYQTGFFQGPEILPLVVLGLVLLFRGKNPLVYILSLAFCTFSNFYFAFHLCVISLIFFVTYLCLHEKKLEGQKKAFCIRWLISSLIGGFLAAPMWLPALKAFTGGGRMDQTGLTEYTFDENMPFIQIFSKLFTGANSINELIAGLPNIFCGILVLSLVILYFMNKRIDIRYRRAAGVVLGIYLLSFYIHAFTLIMHGGTHTNWFPYRYSYVFSFLMICLAVEEFKFIGELTIKETKRCGVVLLVAALIVFGTSYEYISGGTVVLDFTLLLLMWIGFWYFKTKPDKAPLRTLSLLLLILVGINLYANIIICTNKVQSEESWELDLKKFRQNIMASGTLVDALNISEKDFFRMEKDYSESGTVAADPQLYNYNGVSHSGPAERMFIHQELNKLGINWYDMRHWYCEGVPAATDSLLGLKYIISERDLTEEKGYKELLDFMGKKVFRNPYALSVSTLSNNGIEDLELHDNVFRNLNAVWKCMTGESKNIFTEENNVTYSLVSDYNSQSVTSKELEERASATYQQTSKAGISEINNREDNTLEISEAQKNEEKPTEALEGDTSEGSSSNYFQYTFKARKDGPIYVFDTSIPVSNQGLPEPSIRYVGYYKAGDTVEGKFPMKSIDLGYGDFMKDYCVNQVFAYADNKVLADLAKKLNNRDITFNVVHENDLTGTFTSDTDQRILFTIPWDEGWTCYIDGQKVDIDKTWNLFMSVNASAGKHTYEMKFFPAWLNYGIYLAVVAFIGLVVFILIWRRRRAIDLAAFESVSESYPGTNYKPSGNLESSDDSTARSKDKSRTRSWYSRRNSIQTETLPTSIRKRGRKS